MEVTTLNRLFFPICIINIFFISQSVSQCKEEFIEGLKWPLTPADQYASSLPSCLVQNRGVTRRYCNVDSVWEEAPFCTPGVIKCPDGYTYKQEFCYKKIENCQFPPQCKSIDNAPFDKIINVIPRNEEEYFWVPVQMNNSNYGINPMQWIEKTSNYKQFFRINYSKAQNTAIIDNRCVVCTHDCSKAVDFLAVSCKEEYTGICAHEYDANAKEIEESSCSITSETSCSERYFYNDRTCSCKEITAKVSLELRQSETMLYLIVTNPDNLMSEHLIFCFTYATRTSLMFRYGIPGSISETNRTENREIVFEFKPYTEAPGHYWCETFSQPSMDIVTSNTVFVNQNKTELVWILNVLYVRGSNPLRISEIETKQTALDVMFETHEEFEGVTPRIMQILNVDEVSLRMKINTHLTSETINLNDVAKVAKLKFLFETETSANDLFGPEMIQEILNPSLCFSETSGKLTWPITDIGQKARSKEFCFKDDGTVIDRLCDGDFVNGARWSDIDESSCTIPPSSSITEDLEALLYGDGREPKIQLLLKLSKRYDEFNKFDLYLIGEILKQNPYISLKMLSRVINNLLYVDRQVLNSYPEILATDNILDALDKITSRPNYEVQFIDETNFGLLVTNFVDVTGVILSRNENSGIISITTTNENVDEIIQTSDHVDGAFLLNPTLLHQIQEENNGQTLIVTIYKNDIFFIEERSKTKLAKTIFGLNMPYLQDKFQGPIQILQKVDNYSLKMGCAYWKYDFDKLEKGYWLEENDSTDYYSFSLCNYMHTTHFTISASEPDLSEPEVGVKTALDDMLYGNQTVREIVEGLLNISRRYEELDAEDVCTISKIIEKISDDNAIDLNAFAEIISNLHEVNRLTLSTAQTQESATDRILYNADKILTKQDYNSHIEIFEKNFIIVISDIKITNMTGFVLKTSANDTFVAETLFGDKDLEYVKDIPNLDSAIIISSELKQQFLPDDSKIILTVYSTDSLFNEAKNKSTFVSKIFGLILPNTTQLNYSSPLSIVHQISNDGSSNCAHWKYDPDSDGLWFRDTDSKSLSDLVLCEYYHTTHFALLVNNHNQYEDQAKYLEIITTVNCALSLFGLFGIALTAVLYKRWRMNTGNQLLINFVLAMAIQIGTFYASGTIKEKFDDVFCVVIGVALHYSLISQFCWMFIIAILQFKRFVEVFTAPPKHVLFKACLCGWVLPLLPVGCVFFLDQNNYVSSSSGLCYPSDLGLYLGVWLPIAIIVVINTVIFIYIIFSVANRRTECVDTVNNDILFQWRLAVLLFFMLGLTWTFGFLSELDYGIIFVYLFCFTATLQGFVMFLFFIVFNQTTRYLYFHSIKKLCKSYY